MEQIGRQEPANRNVDILKSWPDKKISAIPSDGIFLYVYFLHLPKHEYNEFWKKHIFTNYFPTATGMDILLPFFFFF